MSGDTAAAAAQAGGETQQRKALGGNGGGGNRIQVSSFKKPLFFYVNLAKRYMQQHGDVELSALGLAISTVVTIAEILKNNGPVVEKKIRTIEVEIVLGKTDNFDEVMAAARGEAATSDEEEQT